LASIAPSDKRSPIDRVANDKLKVVEGREAAGTAAVRKNALARAGKSVWSGIKRVNKRVGEAEARLILRVFYYTVFGVVSFALRRGRRKAIESEQAEVVWSPRASSGTDPTKQY
jgi:hypothetical protein